MSKPPGLRDRRKAETRLAISNVATALFIARGFEAVSVDEVAREAAVARKTVFNYFPRKEDLVFDRVEEMHALVREALATRGAQPPLEAFQALMRALVSNGHPIFHMSERPVQFWALVTGSAALTARARELQVAFADDLAHALSEAIGLPQTAPEARLAAAMLVSTLVAAYTEALRAFGEGRDATAAFVALMERGFTGVDAAMAGTAYA